MEPKTNQSYHLLFWLLTSILLFACLGSREIWTQEWRWGEIVRWMLLHHDYFHPMLKHQLYFDKPLISYWLMLLVSQLAGQLSTWTIRLPSAIAGLISILCFYQIGITWQNRKIANIATMMLATCYYFLFWARTASSDMLNIAGILSAVAWYFCKREQPNVINYSIFFSLLAFTALLKGLIAPVIVLLVILPDAILRLRKYLQWQLLIALVPAILIYLLPFWLTSLENHTSLAQNGLYQVYRENILRFFEPFDHKAPIYTYFIYLPVYLLPWSIFFLFALYQLPKYWRKLTSSAKQLAISNASVFLFLTLSGSRRSYYILPLLPFTILFTAEWINRSETRIKFARYTASISFLALLGWFVLLQPLYYSNGGLPKFSQQLTYLMAKKSTEKTWRIAFLNADNRLSFYLPHYDITFLTTETLDNTALFKQYDVLITQTANLKQIKNLSTHQLLFTEPHRGNQYLGNTVTDAPVAIFSTRIDYIPHATRATSQQVQGRARRPVPKGEAKIDG